MGSVSRFDFIPIGIRSKVLLLLAVHKFINPIELFPISFSTFLRTVWFTLASCVYLWKLSCLLYEVPYHLNSSLKSFQPSQLIPKSLSNHLDSSMKFQPSRLIPEVPSHFDSSLKFLTIHLNSSKQIPKILTHPWSSQTSRLIPAVPDHLNPFLKFPTMPTHPWNSNCINQSLKISSILTRPWSFQPS